MHLSILQLPTQRSDLSSHGHELSRIGTLRLLGTPWQEDDSASLVPFPRLLLG